MTSKQIYTVHIKPDSKNPYENAVFIGESFNIWAFVLNVAWAFYHRLWLLAAGLIVFKVLLQYAISHLGFSPIHGIIVELGIQVLLGFHANDLRRANLRKKGYITGDIVVGNTLVAAEQRFFERHYLSQPSMRHEPVG